MKSEPGARETATCSLDKPLSIPQIAFTPASTIEADKQAGDRHQGKIYRNLAIGYFAADKDMGANRK